MPRLYTPYIPQTIGEVMEVLVRIMFDSPRFEDDSGYFPGRNIDTEFFALNGGLKAIREKVGDESYGAPIALSDRIRAHFEADPDDATEDGIAGRELVLEMEDFLKAAARRKR